MTKNTKSLYCTAALISILTGGAVQAQEPISLIATKPYVASTASYTVGDTLVPSRLPEGYRNIYNDRTKIVKFDRLMLDAAEEGNIEKIKSLVRRGYSVNTPAQYGTTPLMRASFHGYDDVVTYLLENGADVNATDDMGMSAVAFAMVADHKSTEEILLANGAIEMRGEYEPAAFPLIALLPAVATSTPIAVAAGAAAITVSGAVVNEITSGTKTTTPTTGGTPVNPNDITAAEAAATGKGVIVAIIDNGVKTTADLDLEGGGTFTTNLTLHADSTDFRDATGPNDGTVEGAGAMEDHGTQVATVINDIAPDAELLSLRAFNSTLGENYQDAAVGDAIDYAVSKGAKVINNSFGHAHDLQVLYDLDQDPANSTMVNNITRSFSPDTIIAIEAALDPARAEADRPVFVWAAGNRYTGDTGGANPSVLAGLFTLNEFKDFENNWLVAVSVDDNGNSNYTVNSNQCGLAQARCMAAIAGSSSLSAAQVSAAVSKLIESGLTPEAAAQRVLDTAVYLDASGNIDSDSNTDTNSATGHGLLNSKLALSPMGTTLVKLNQSGSFSVLFGGSNVQASGAFGDAFANSNSSFVFFDNNGDSDSSKGSAAFNIALSDISANNDIKTNLIDILSEYGENFSTEINFAGGVIAYTPYDNHKQGKIESSDEIAFTETGKGKMSFTVEGKKGTTSFNHNVAMDRAFGFGAIDGVDASMLISEDSHRNPYLGFAKDGVSMVSDYEINDNFTIRNGSFRGTDKKQFGSEVTTSGLVTELVSRFDNASFGLQGGFMEESGAFLGTRAQGAFALDKKTPTMFYGVSGQYSITDKMNVFGSYTQGLSTPETVEVSLISDISQIRSEAFSLGLSYSEIFSDNDGFGLSVSQPLRVSSGNVSFAYNNGTNDVNSTASLTPSAREIDYEAYYNIGLDNHTSLKAGAMYRQNPGHIENAEDEGIFMLRAKRDF